MTRTEERLADALQASAGRVRDDRLRPLSQPEPGLGPESRPRTTWRGWLVPLAAAAAVALVIGLALVGTGGGRPDTGGPAAGRGSTAATTGLPRFFAQLTGTNPVDSTVVIRSVTTGEVVASASLPGQAGWSMLADAMAAAPDGRTFYVAYTAIHAGTAQTRIYRFGFNGIAPNLIKGGVIPGSASVVLHGSMAVSPDGTKLALTVATPGHDGDGPGSMDELAVIDLRTGIRTTWQGGLDRPGRALLIRDVSWRADGRSVVFLALWCNPAVALDLCAGATVPVTARAAEVRALGVASGGGSLDRGAVLMSQQSTLYVIAHAVAGPGPGGLTLVLLTGRTTTAGTWPVVIVERVTARSGLQAAVDYRLAAKNPSQRPHDVELGADPSGQHLLLTLDRPSGFLFGWIGQGKLHPLPVSLPHYGHSITAW